MLDNSDIDRRPLREWLTVNPGDMEAVAFWAVVLHVAPNEIVHAVASVGGDAGAIERFVRARTAAQLGVKHYAHAAG